MSFLEKAFLLLLLLLALLLRGSGLSHDLHEGLVYHPDSPKQINAIQRFYEGNYYWHTGLKDYDGYPLLHAHLAEWILRAIEPLRRLVCLWLGLPPAPGLLLQPLALYWLVLGMNVLLATATVLLAFLAGREAFHPGIGWIAAVLLTLSPADITSAHMATGDTTTAFFAALSLFFSLRVYRLGRHRDYAWAAATAVLAFAAKYYAATAFVTLALAHLGRSGFARPSAWFNREGRRRIALAAGVAVLAFLLAEPGLFVDFRGQLTDIWQAMLVSTQRFPVSMQGAGRWARFLYSMHVNLPGLLCSITAVSLVAVLGLLVSSRRRDPRFWILLIGPVLYVLLAVGSRGPVNPVYHTAITPSLFLLIGFASSDAWSWPAPWRGSGRLLATLGLILSVWLLGRVAARESFFPAQMDTRRMAEAWSKENVPACFAAKTSRYTFIWSWPAHSAEDVKGVLVAGSELDPPAAFDQVVPLKRFELERDAMTQFRNVPQEIAVWSPSWLREGFNVPVTQRWPTQTGNAFIFDHGVEFWRSEKVCVVQANETYERYLVTEKPLDEVWLSVQAFRLPTRLRIAFGGRHQTVALTTNAWACFPLARLRPSFPSTDDRRFYPYRISSATGPARVTLATSHGGRAGLLLQAGRDGEAAPLLMAEAQRLQHPTLAAQAILACRRAGLPATQVPVDVLHLAERLAQVSDASTLQALYGLHPAYLEALPFLQIPAEQLSASGYCLKAHPEAGPDGPVEYVTSVVADRRPGDDFELHTYPLLLEAGHYAGRLRVRSLSGASSQQTLRLRVLGSDLQPFAEQALVLPALDGRPYTDVSFPLTIAPGCSGCILHFYSAEPLDLAVGGIDIRPDLLVELAALRDLLSARR